LAPKAIFHGLFTEILSGADLVHLVDEQMRGTSRNLSASCQTCSRLRSTPPFRRDFNGTFAHAQAASTSTVKVDVTRV